MEEIRLTPKTYTVGGMGTEKDHRPVAFEGELVCSVDPSGRDDRGGTRYEVYRTAPKPSDDQEKIIVKIIPWSVYQGTTMTIQVVVFPSVRAFMDGVDATIYPESQYGVEIPDYVKAAVEEELGLDPAIRV